LLLTVIAACELAPIDLEGLRCDDARPCGEGFECHEGVCVLEGSVIEVDAGIDAGVDAGFDAGQPDAGGDAGVDGGIDAGFDAGLPRGVNLLQNPGFESVTSDGGVSAWRASTGRLLRADGIAHAGNRSARFQSSSMAQLPVLIPTTDTRGAELGMLFCASVWMRGDEDAGVDLTLTIRDRFFDGGTATSSGTRLTVRSQWVQLKEEYASIGTSDIQLRVTSNTRLDAGEGVWVDDAWLSVAQNGVCP
jgi:rhodanese-related sulfurtransferase